MELGRFDALTARLEEEAFDKRERRRGARAERLAR